MKRNLEFGVALSLLIEPMTEQNTVQRESEWADSLYLFRVFIDENIEHLQNKIILHVSDPANFNKIFGCNLV